MYIYIYLYIYKLPYLETEYMRSPLFVVNKFTGLSMISLELVGLLLVFQWKFFVLTLR